MVFVSCRSDAIYDEEDGEGHHREHLRCYDHFGLDVAENVHFAQILTLILKDLLQLSPQRSGLLK